MRRQVAPADAHSLPKMRRHAFAGPSPLVELPDAMLGGRLAVRNVVGLCVLAEPELVGALRDVPGWPSEFSRFGQN